MGNIFLWRTTSAIIDNTEYVVGRMYRKWLNNGQVTIKLTAFNADTPYDVEGMDALPNDPGYLMAHTSCPVPFVDVKQAVPPNQYKASCD